MKNMLLALLIIAAGVMAGCTPVQPPAAEEEVTTEEFSEEEVVVESDDGMDPEEARLRQGDGYMMNLVDNYTMPIADGDTEATPDQVLTDSAGKEYKIVDHIGPETPQE